MFARVQTVHQPAEKLDALARMASDQFASGPDLGGFRGFYYLVDREQEKAIVLSLWETEEDLRRLEASNASARAQVQAEARVESPGSEVFEVVFSSTDSSSRSR